MSPPARNSAPATARGRRGCGRSDAVSWRDGPPPRCTARSGSTRERPPRSCTTIATPQGNSDLGGHHRLRRRHDDRRCTRDDARTHGARMACRYPLDAAVTAIDAVANAPRLKVADVALLADGNRRRGIPHARKVLELVDPGAESPKETWLRLLVIRNGFPPPTTQIPVYDDFGGTDRRVGHGLGAPQAGARLRSTTAIRSASTKTSDSTTP